MHHLKQQFADKCALSADSTRLVANGTAEGSDDDDVEMQRGHSNLTAEQGLKHLLLTVDVERLYRQVPFCGLLANFGNRSPPSGVSHWLESQLVNKPSPCCLSDLLVCNTTADALLSVPNRTASKDVHL